MKTFNMKETMPTDLIEVINNIADINVNIELDDKYKVYEHKVQRLKSLTRNYSAKYGYYYQSRLNSARVNYRIDRIDITVEELKAFNKYNEIMSDCDYLMSFDHDFITNIRQMHKLMPGVTNRGKFRTNDNIINVANEYDIELIPVPNTDLYTYMEEIQKVHDSEWDNLQRFINSWCVHCYFIGLQAFSSANGRAGRFLLNKNINIYRDESIFLDPYIFEDMPGYYQAIFDFCCEKEFSKSAEWFVAMLKTAIDKECEKLDGYLLKFYDLLDKFETMELVVSRHAEMLATLFCTGGLYIHGDIVNFLSQDILDNRTIKKIINTLLENELLSCENKIYFTNESWI